MLGLLVPNHLQGSWLLNLLVWKRWVWSSAGKNLENFKMKRYHYSPPSWRLVLVIHGLDFSWFNHSSHRWPCQHCPVPQKSISKLRKSGGKLLAEQRWHLIRCSHCAGIQAGEYNSRQGSFFCPHCLAWMGKLTNFSRSSPRGLNKRNLHLFVTGLAPYAELSAKCG